MIIDIINIMELYNCIGSLKIINNSNLVLSILITCPFACALYRYHIPSITFEGAPTAYLGWTGIEGNTLCGKYSHESWQLSGANSNVAAPLAWELAYNRSTPCYTTITTIYTLHSNTLHTTHNTLHHSTIK
jgi:hypothetical protein